MKGVIRILQDVGLLVARVAVGLLMMMHGWARWNGDGGMARQVEILTEHSVAQPQLVAWGTVLLEVVGGVLLIFGAFVPGVAMFLLVQQVLIIALIKWSRGPALEAGGYEYNLMTAAAALMLLVFGSGRAGVDALFRRPRSEERRTRADRGSTAVDDHAPA